MSTLLRPHPHLLEADARTCVPRWAGGGGGTSATLADLTPGALREATRHFDLLWLMGLWCRSPASRLEALKHADLRRRYDETLPGWTEADVGGSPFAVRAFDPDPALGGWPAVAGLRRRLRETGVRLVVDFVPNHLARDHPWTLDHPEWFVRGTPEDALRRAGDFFETPAGHLLAHGRDPHFPPWTDTAQVNFFHPQSREALIGELIRIAGGADGVRCDMAMLALSEVFELVWGGAAGPVHEPRPEREFWEEAIERSRSVNREFVFIGEAYWGLEGRLLDLGFDYVYDKTFHDLLVGSGAQEIRAHLARAGPLLDRGVRFLENHDEPRCAVTLGERQRAAAVALMTLPGLRFIHDGQTEGRRVHRPVQLLRESPEPADESLRRFYGRLMAVSDWPALHEGDWTMLEPGPALPEAADRSFRNVLAWCWEHRAGRHVTLVNYGPHPAGATVALPVSGEARGPVAWMDRLGGLGGSAVAQGAPGALVTHLEPWSGCILAPAGDAPRT